MSWLQTPPPHTQLSGGDQGSVCSLAKPAGDRIEPSPPSPGVPHRPFRARKADEKCLQHKAQHPWPLSVAQLGSPGCRGSGRVVFARLCICLHGGGIIHAKLPQEAFGPWVVGAAHGKSSSEEAVWRARVCAKLGSC